MEPQGTLAENIKSVECLQLLNTHAHPYSIPSLSLYRLFAKNVESFPACHLFSTLRLIGAETENIILVLCLLTRDIGCVPPRICVRIQGVLYHGVHASLPLVFCFACRFNGLGALGAQGFDRIDYEVALEFCRCMSVHHTSTTS